MRFQNPDLMKASQAIATSLREISSPYNDGWTVSACKKELYLLKLWLDEEYKKLPKFFEEQQWEKERLIEILKKE